MVLIRALAVWLLIICLETIHGILRTMFLAPRVGDFHARQVSVFTGSLLIVLVAYLLIRWVGIYRTKSLLLVGILWLTLTLVFEVVLGRVILGLSWERILEDYDIRNGGLLFFGTLVLTFAPLMAARLRGETTVHDRK